MRGCELDIEGIGAARAVEKLVLEESASEAFEAFLSAADGADEADCEGAQTAKQNQKPAGKTAGPRKKAEKKDE